MISDVVKKIESLAPLDLAEEWDNSGWQIRLDEQKVLKVMLALSPTLDVIEQAKELGCNLVVTHHPLFFSKIKQIVPSTIQNKVAIKSIQNGIQIYCAHTNLDKAQGGINDCLAELFGMRNIAVKFDIVRVGEIDSMDLDSFVQKVKQQLGCEELKLINPAAITQIKKVAICSGAGSDFINKVDADVFITGDVKYHSAIEVQDKIVIDAGHFETEQIILPYLKEFLSEYDVVVAQEKRPWIVI